MEPNIQSTYVYWRTTTKDRDVEKPLASSGVGVLYVAVDRRSDGAPAGVAYVSFQAGDRGSGGAALHLTEGDLERYGDLILSARDELARQRRERKAPEEAAPPQEQFIRPNYLGLAKDPEPPDDEKVGGTE